jgi:MFS family permease
MSDHGTGVIELELMRTTQKAEQVLRDYGSEGRSAARTSLWLDYPYLVSYALFFSLACGAIADRADRSGRERWAAVGAVLAWGALAAGLFDAVENAALLRVLDGHPEQPYPAIAYLCAVPKFVLSSAALLYIVAGLIVLRRRRAGPA